MLDRSVKWDLAALVLLAVVVFFGLALATYRSDDPAPEVPYLSAYLPPHQVLVHPAADTIRNWCGKWGALAAELSLELLGVGAYYLAVSLAVVDLVLLRRQHITLPVLRLAGWLASLTGLTAAATLLLPGWFCPGVMGPGGYLGALGKGLLHQHFAAAGSMIVATALAAGGVLLATDYAIFRFAFWCYEKFGQTWSHGQWLVGRRLARAAAAPVAATAAGKTTGGVAVKIKGKRMDDLAGVDLESVVTDDADDELPATIPLRAKSSAKSAPPVADADEHEDDDTEDENGVPATVALPVVAAASAAVAPAAKMPAEPAVKSSRQKAQASKGEGQREQVMKELEAASRAEEPVEYQLPEIDLLLESEDFNFDQQATEVRKKAKMIEKTFADFGFQVRVVEIETGPVIAQYEVELEAGLRLSKITGLADDLAIALRVPSVRIVAPIPGKNTVGIEVPNEERQIVRLREVMEEANGKVKKMRIPLFLGKDVSGNPLVVDLSTLPHLLIAGRTGTGKSVCLNAIITSLLMTRRPDEVRMLMIDPKMVELSGYGTLPHLMHPVVTDMRKAEAILAWAVEKMEERYALLARAGVRHVSAYNQLGEEEIMERLQPETDEDRQSIPLHLPYIVIVADEIADMMMTAGKEVEQHIIRLAQKSRAVGIHLILATQKPTVDVITGLIKSNLPARICFQVASRVDSRVVLDEMGADKLLGNGDMLFLWPGTSTLLRGQGTYVSDEEIIAIVDAVSTGEQDFVKELVQLKPKPPAGEEGQVAFKRRDDMYEEAVEVVIREGRGSCSLLQRALGIGYGRAARLIDFMAEDGIVGAYAGSQAREVLISLDDWARMKGEEAAAAEEPAPPKRTNKVVLRKPRPVVLDDERDEDEVDSLDAERMDTDDDHAAALAEEEEDDDDRESLRDDTEMTDEDEADETDEAESDDEELDDDSSQELDDEASADDPEQQHEHEDFAVKSQSTSAAKDDNDDQDADDRPSGKSNSDNSARILRRRRLRKSS